MKDKERTRKPVGRPKEKGPSTKLTLGLEDDVIAMLDELAITGERTSRTKIVERLVRAAYGTRKPTAFSLNENTVNSGHRQFEGKQEEVERIVSEKEQRHAFRKKAQAVH